MYVSESKEDEGIPVNGFAVLKLSARQQSTPRTKLAHSVSRSPFFFIAGTPAFDSLEDLRDFAAQIRRKRRLEVQIGSVEQLKPFR